MPGLIVGVDTSAACRRAVEFAAHEAVGTDSPLTLVHVIPWSPYSFTTPAENEHRSTSRAAEIKAAEDQVMAPVAEIARGLGAEPTLVVKHGNETEILLSLAKKIGATQFFVGKTGESALRQVVFGSTPSKLIQHSPIPVTVIP